MQSMTGFGEADCQYRGTTISISLKSVNSSRGLEIKVNVPNELRALGLEKTIQKMMNQRVIRGSLNCSITLHRKKQERPVAKINFKAWEQQAKAIRKQFLKRNKTTISKKESIAMAMDLSNLVEHKNESKADTTPKDTYTTLLEDALEQLVTYRKNEGDTLEKVILENLQHISDQIPAIEQLQDDRKDGIRSRLKMILEEGKSSESKKIDENRLEQELIYYIEKYDIAEEIDRLKAHIPLFEATQKQQGAIGKKLGFIGQEIGREINTIGSKANFTPIQHLVIEMKDRLEKIKEQLANVL